MQVTICHQAVTATASPDEADVLHQVQVVQAGLVALGVRTSVLPCGLDLSQTAAALHGCPPDIVFNLVESLDERGEMIAVVPSLLDALDIVYTGASAEALFLTSNKLLARQRMRDLGLPIASCPNDSTSGSFIIKSVWEHASRGLDAGSVVPFQAISRELETRERTYGGRFFAEAYVPGREFNVSLLAGADGPRALPVAEIVFEGYSDAAPRIVDYAAKWDADSSQYQGTRRRFVSEDESALSQRLQELALHCWYGFELDGYARIDFRVAGEQIAILDVNANPCLAPDAGFRAALDRSEIAFQRALERIIEAASVRRPNARARKTRAVNAAHSTESRRPNTDSQIR